MKKFLFVALGLLALPSVASAININAGGVQPTWDFTTAPVIADFATGVTPGANTVINDTTTWDTTVNASAASVYASAVGTSATNPPTTTANVFRHNTDPAALWLQSSATGGSSVGLVAKLDNETPNYISSLTVDFDFAETAAETGTTTGPPGYRVYWSPTGATGSWSFLGAPLASQHYSFNIPALGTTFGDNTGYVLWSDDNAEGGTDGQYHIDNVTFNATLGGLKAPPVPVFGNVAPPQTQNFETPGTGLPLNNGAQGTVVALNGSQQLQINGTALNATSDQVDLRGVAAGSNKVVGVDLKAWETSATSDFEAADHVIVSAEWSSDGLAFTSVDLVNLVGAPALTPFDPNVPNPADQIRAAFGPTEAVNNAAQPSVHYQVTLPSTAQTVRIHVNLSTDSATEFMAIDNITVTAVPVPEPASVAMIGLGMIGLVGYGIRRRRSA
jgi:hypothetical protein